MSLSIDTLLLDPQEGGNLGSICRGLKTLGFGPPKVISAPEGIERSPAARRLAHGAREYLEEIERYDTLEEIAPSYDFVVGTTARKRRSVLEYVEIREVAPLILTKGESAKRVAILFGSEASGLPSSVLNQCDLVSTVPLRTSYPSLNLAQAVLLYAYELAPLLERSDEGGRPAAREGASSAESRGEESPAYRALLQRTVRLLSERAVNEPLIGRVRERLAHVEEGDVALIHSILNALEGPTGRSRRE